MVCSLLLDYPDESFPQRLQACRDALAELPEQVAGPLERFLASATQLGQRALAEHYVETFDRRRRCCLYLSYYAVGDTRHRGAALLAFKQALAGAGWEQTSDELPDYLPLVLELSARSDDEIAAILLGSHREGIEVLLRALRSYHSPYAAIIEALSATLAPVDEATAARVAALIHAGPPTETVGVTNILPFPTTAPRLAAQNEAPAVDAVQV
jgi:nitrate reductase molybdenum cofactor assembly chaperone